MLNKVKLFLGGFIVSLFDYMVEDYFKDCIKLERDKHGKYVCICCGCYEIAGYRNLKGMVIGYHCENCEEPLAPPED